MALTRVSGNIIDQPFDVGIITATNQYVSGIGTFGNIRVLGDLQVDGTTTTLDTVVTEVDRLEIGANNSTVGVAITQSGTGDILNLYDGSTEVFSVADGGDVSIIDKIVHAGDTDTAIRFPAADTITAETDGSEILRITSGGLVGINTITPSEKLDVWGTIRASAGTNQYMHMYPVAGAGYFDVKNSTTYPSIVFRQIGSAGTQEALRITSNGSVGIGTDNPQTALEIGKGHTDPVIRLNDSANRRMSIRGPSANNFASVGTETSNALIFFTNGYSNERLRITSGGLVGINKTPSTYQFEVSGGSANTVASFESSDAISRILFKDNSGEAMVGAVGDALTFYTSTNATERLRILANGTVDFKDNNISNVGTIALDSIKGDADDNTNITFAGNDTITFKAGSTSPALTINTTQVKIEDNQKFVAGTGNDLQIYHNSGNFIKGATLNNLFIDSQMAIQLRTGSNDKLAIACQPDAEVQIWHNQVEKFRTLSTGVRVTGALEVTQEYPSIRPTLDLNFAATKTLDRRITFTRNSVGTFIGEDGLVKYASNNVPRFDHDPETGESLGLLIEESRTNIAPYGNDMSQFGSFNMTKTANNAVAPDGTTTATKLENGGGSGNNWYLDYTESSINAQNAGTYTYSVWVKAPDDQPDDYYGCRISLLHSTGGNVEVTFGLSRNWRRISVTKTYGASDSGNLRVHPIIFRASPGSTHDGKVVPSYVWVWGAQLEQSSFPTSYIPTSGSSVTRAKDTARITGTNFTDLMIELDL